MPRYVRAKIAGGTFFFTVAIADRSDDLLVREIDRLRDSYRMVQERRPFETIAICILPDHLHALWTLPDDDADFSTRWNLIKGSSHTDMAASRGVRRAVSRSARKDSGSVAIGSTPFATSWIWRATLITSTSIRCGTSSCRALAIGRTAASIAMSRAATCPRTGAATCARSAEHSANDGAHRREP